MQAALLPASVICPTCNSVMHLRRYGASQHTGQVIVYCGMASCADRHTAYTLDLPTSELVPAHADAKAEAAKPAEAA